MVGWWYIPALLCSTKAPFCPHALPSQHRLARGRGGAGGLRAGAGAQAGARAGGGQDGAGAGQRRHGRAEVTERTATFLATPDTAVGAPSTRFPYVLMQLR